MAMAEVKRLAVVAFVTLASSALVAQSQQPQAEWQRKYELGLKHRTASELYMALKHAAASGRQALPDWSGVWTSAGFGSWFRPGPGGVAPKLTPAAAAKLKETAELNARGISYDENLSACGPAGYPRWLAEPFLREFVLAPNQTWLINEMMNEIRRIYTDGRDHTPEADRYPLVDGDSIGFWDGQKLVIHTNQLMARAMGRNSPDQSDQMETVEIWEEVDTRTIAVDVWLYDPAVYLEPWYVQRRYSPVSNADKNLRIRYWNCSENPNNAVVKTKDGSTDFKDLTFTDKEKAEEPRR
jgi:hypothetical protein